MKRLNKFLALLAAFAMILAACGGDDAADYGDTGGDDELIIGVSWNNYNEERWAALDEPPMQAAIEDAGGVYVNTNANSSAK